MSDLVTLYGTRQAPVESRGFTTGDLSFTVEAGALRHVRLGDAEAIRGIAFLVRDRDWGTLEPTISDETVQITDKTLLITYHAQYQSHGASLDVDIRISATPDGLSMAATGHATGAFQTNRTGFSVLHPIKDVAGQPLRVTHGGGTVEEARFPDLIAPWQPFVDISALTHHVAGQDVTCQFLGDTFEMEDQRQWGDASFKTYNRPLAKPWPYAIADGAALEQSVALSWTPGRASAPAQPKPALPRVTFPEMALVVTPQEARRLAGAPADIDIVGPQRLLCHLDATLGETAVRFDAFAQAQRACPHVTFDLELICRCDPDPAPELLGLAKQMRAAGFAPDSVMVCPSVDRQSTPPGSNWPPCPPLERVHEAAARAFPDLSRGGGMVSFFPELNRKRPPVGALDFVSHGLCPIIHAADDLSVMETLEAIPHITRSARAMIGDRAYRIGPATIAMRQNPYGQRTIPNPDQGRVCMTDDDPRHRARFGAAYALGLATALAPAGIAVWTPAALYGPRGVIAETGSWPLTRALGELAACAGQPVRAATLENGIARLHVGDTRFTANLTPHARDGLGPYDWRLGPA